MDRPSAARKRPRDPDPADRDFGSAGGGVGGGGGAFAREYPEEGGGADGNDDAVEEGEDDDPDDVQRRLLDDLVRDGDDDFAAAERRRREEAERKRRSRRQRLERLKQQETQTEEGGGRQQQDQQDQQQQQQQQQQPALGTKREFPDVGGGGGGRSGTSEATTPQPQAVVAAAAEKNAAPWRTATTKTEGTGEEGGGDRDRDGDEAKSRGGDGEDDFDMFSGSASPPPPPSGAASKKRSASSNADGTADPKRRASAAQTTSAEQEQRGQEQEDWDDPEGYYKAVIGEVIALDNIASGGDDAAIRFRVLGNIGKGVFSTVLKCATVSNSSRVHDVPPTVAIKCIRHNETMRKAALQEIRLLQKFVVPPPSNQRHANHSQQQQQQQQQQQTTTTTTPGIVPLLLPVASAMTGGADSTPALEYRGHLLLVFPFMEYNLRDVLQKFGKGVGLSLQAARSYFGQLLAAATHLKRHGIIHADIKPDNILVSADFSTCQIADFGSAATSDAPEVQVTPYLVSRFYRAPEIILGLPPTHAIDLWSLAASVGELYLGKVLFRGASNNEMLYAFMQHLNAFSNRMIRQHLLACDKYPIPKHFEKSPSGGNAYLFLHETVDPVTGNAVHRPLPLYVAGRGGTDNGRGDEGNRQPPRPPKFPNATPLHPKLMKARAASDPRALTIQFSDLLHRCLSLDPNRRIDLRDALRHDFFKATATANTTTTTTPMTTTTAANAATTSATTTTASSAKAEP